MRAWVVAVILGSLFRCGMAQTVSPLYARGYTVVPQPQRVSLGSREFTFSQEWQLKLDASVPPDDVAVATFRQDLGDRFNLTLGAAGKSAGTVTLRIVRGSVQIGQALDHDKSALEEQAYRIDLHPDAITVTGNTSTGLFYGVETLIQLLKRSSGTLRLPEGTIDDWPDLRLRLMFWDDNHRLEHVDELKREVRQAAFFKMNGFELKLSGHFQYKSAPAVVEPDALTPAELQDLTDYALRYHVQLIPYADGPSHVSFILKHPEYSSLRAFPDNNYEMCLTNPGTYKLLRGMYQDLLDASKGGKYFYISMDEPYYMGLAHNSQCDEADLAKRLGSSGRLFTSFIDQAGDSLHDQGRTVLFWGAFPLKPNDVPSLSPHLIGNFYGPERAELDQNARQRGMQQIISTQYINDGNSRLFPGYFALPLAQRLHQGNGGISDLLSEIMNKISFQPARLDSDVIGEVTSGWGDKGINPETFWLGYVAGAAAGWHPGPPNTPEVEDEFYSLFYGSGIAGMNRIYQLLSEQDQGWGDTWDSVDSTVRKPIWGGAYGQIYNPRRPAKEQTLPLPPVPDGNLAYSSTWSNDNAKRLALTAEATRENDTLLGMLAENIRTVQLNRYNLEVYLSIANLYRQGFDMIAGIHNMDALLTSAARESLQDPARALSDVDSALDVAGSIWRQRNQALQNAVDTWDVVSFSRVADANGRHFLFELDDVKDHLADRTVDLSYLVYREKTLAFGEWVNAILASRNQYATAHQLPARELRWKWDDISATYTACSPLFERESKIAAERTSSAFGCSSGDWPVL